MINEIKDKALENHIPIICDDSLKYIIDIIKNKNINKMLEIGTAVGYSAICFSKYVNHIDTVELNEERYKEAISNIEKCKILNINVTLSDAYEYMKSLNDKYDFIFIDAAKGQYLHYLEEAKRLLNDNGIIIADNILFKGRVLSDYNEKKHRTAVNRLREYIEIMKNDTDFKTEIIDIGDGIAVSYKLDKG